MAIVMLGELLDRARAFEDRLALYFESLRDQSRDNGVRLLTYYMRRHRRHQREMIAELAPDLLAHIREIKVRHDMTFQPETAFYTLTVPPAEMTGEQLLTAAVKYDETLLDFYRQILAEPVNVEARSVIESMIQIEEYDLVVMKKMIAMGYF